ncbi:MAG: lysoplasmalogenase [Treponema sp.]|nr:lysoplasmalogenase [Treponema sp.]
MSLHHIFLVILGVVSLVYLTTLKFKPGLFQFILKSCLMPLVFAIYLTGAGQGKVFWPIITALVFAWIGDILLVRITNILWFKLGLASFLTGHIFYIVAMYGYAVPFNVPVLVISIIIAACFGVMAYKVVRPSKQMKIPVIAYETIILLMAIFACQLFIAQSSVNLYFGAFVLAGSICFVISDTLLALKTFRRVRIYFAVMVTYIAAQLLIALGFSML